MTDRRDHPMTDPDPPPGPTMTYPCEELTPAEQAAYDAALAEQITEAELAWQAGDQEDS